ncbi:Mariner Mos1 transposase [Eumeta japonica]|uniref:Mariner Mos1 transposase n=1 Tax=Eumeta variegata TaxID=151549 RepID=A0A4C1U3H4_EUMVA|nr:Mariner Mos1 transposase [Eumeta japonica]
MLSTVPNGHGLRQRSQWKPKIYEDAELEEDSFQTQKELALTLKVTQQTVSHRLKSLGMIHKQDIAPSDYHLFRSMAHALSEQRFTSYEDTKNWVDWWIGLKDRVLQTWNPNAA